MSRRPAQSVGDVIEQALTLALARKHRARLQRPCAPSHPLRGMGIEADDLVLEIARWLLPADAWALGSCARRFRALATWTNRLFPWRWRWRHLTFEPIRVAMHACRWRAPLLAWKERALHRAARITISVRCLAWSEEGLWAMPKIIVTDQDTERSRLFFRLRRRTRMRKLLNAATDRLEWQGVFPHRVLLIRTGEIHAMLGTVAASVESGRITGKQLLCVHRPDFDVGRRHPLYFMDDVPPFDSRRSFPADLCEDEELTLVGDVRADVGYEKLELELARFAVVGGYMDPSHPTLQPVVGDWVSPDDGDEVG